MKSDMVTKQAVHRQINEWVASGESEKNLLSLHERIDALLPASPYILANMLGYKDGKADTPFTDTEEAEKKAYGRGLNDAWEVARKLVHPRLGGYTEEQKQRIFGEYVSSDSILQNFTAPEAIAKIKEYEDKQTEDEEKDTIKEHLAEFRATLGCSYGEIYEVLEEMRGAE